MIKQTYAEFRPKTRLQIADEYGQSYRNLKRKLDRVDIQLPSGDVYPEWQKVIYEHLGYPNPSLKEQFKAFS